MLPYFRFQTVMGIEFDHYHEKVRERHVKPKYDIKIYRVIFCRGYPKMKENGCVELMWGLFIIISSYDGNVL